MISTLTAATMTVAMAPIMNYSIIALIVLIALLGLKEILSSESHENKRLQSFVKGTNVVIVPLLIVFIATVAYKVIAII